MASETISIKINADDNASVALGKLKRKLNATGKAAKKTGKKFDPGLKNSLLSLKTAGIAAAGVIGTKLAGSILKVNSKFEDLQMQFKPLLGSMEAAKKRMSELEDFAMVTPYQVEQVAAGSKVLQSFGGDAMATGDKLRMVGDAASFAGIEFDEMATWVGRAYSGLKNGRPVGEAMQRMQELAVLTGDARTKIERLQEQGKDMKAWKVLQDSLKRTGGTMKDMQKTFSGQWSTLVGRVKKAVRQVTGGSFDFLKTKIKEVSKNIKDMVDSGRLEEFASEVTKNFKKVYKVTESLIRITQKVAKAFRETWSVINKITDRIFPKIFGWYTKLINKAGEAIKKHNEALKANRENLNLRYESQKQVLAQAKKVMKLQKKIAEGERFKTKSKRGGSGVQITKAGVEAMRAGDKAALSIEQAKENLAILKERMKTQFGSDFVNSLPEQLVSEEGIQKLSKRLNRIKKMMNKTTEAGGTGGGAGGGADGGAGVGGAGGDGGGGGDKEKTNIPFPIAVKEYAQGLQKAKKVRDSMALKVRQANMTDYQIEKQRIMSQYQEKKELLQQYNLSTIELTKWKNNELEKLDKKRAEHQKKTLRENAAATAKTFGGMSELFEQAASENKEFAVAQKTMATTQAVINTYLAATKALSQGGAISGPLMMAGVIATGMAQVAKINSQRFASSGIVEGDKVGDNNIARVNGGEAVVSRADQRNFLQEVKRPNTTGNSSNVNVNIYGDTSEQKASDIAEEIVKQQREAEYFNVS